MKYVLARGFSRLRQWHIPNIYFIHYNLDIYMTTSVLGIRLYPLTYSGPADLVG